MPEDLSGIFLPRKDSKPNGRIDSLIESCTTNLPMLKPEHTMRPATGDDYEYCYRLTKRNMAGLFTRHWGGWVPAKFREEFVVDAVSIIVVGGRRAGYLSVKRRQEGPYIDNIQLSPPLHGRGIGTSILAQLLADHPGESVVLTTFSDNPAKRLYERLGFRVAGREGNTLRMARPPINNRPWKEE